jgi:membrane fusion protein, multidrug efflux system
MPHHTSSTAQRLRFRRRVSRPVGGTAWIALGCAIQATSLSAQDTKSPQPFRGVVRAVHQASFSTELATPVAAIGAREGQRFKAGDPLLEFDCRRQHHELSALAATVREAQVTHESNAHLLRNGASNRNDVTIAQARLQKAEAEHAALKQRLTGCHVAAPFDGIVVEISVNVHELPPSGKPLMIIVSDRHLEIEVIVPSRELPRLIAGIRFDFTVDETQRIYTAHVLRTGGAVDPVSQTAKVYATFSATFEDVVPGMSGTALWQRKSP